MHADYKIKAFPSRGEYPIYGLFASASVYASGLKTARESVGDSKLIANILRYFSVQLKARYVNEIKNTYMYIVHAHKM